MLTQMDGFDNFKPLALDKNGTITQTKGTHDSRKFY
jgi:hypothetical protein